MLQLCKCGANVQSIESSLHFLKVGASIPVDILKYSPLTALSSTAILRVPHKLVPRSLSPPTLIYLCVPLPIHTVSS